MVSDTKVLVVMNSTFVSGAEMSLIEFLEKSKKKSCFALATSQELQYVLNFESGSMYNFPFKWFCRTRNPINLFVYALNILKCSIPLIQLNRRIVGEYVYANTSKSFIYALILKLFARKKIICHLRDNLKPSFYNRLLIKHTDRIVTVSRHIAEQIEKEHDDVRIIHWGVNTKDWSPTKQSGDIRSELGVSDDSVLIVTVGQFTRWKNQTDFIKAASLIVAEYPNTHFILVGDDLLGKETKYRRELKETVDEYNLNQFISFLGNRMDIKELLNQIDILIHPAINEPFGRVLIEGMVMEKPIIAYNCGGPKEIIINNETGYLVDPYDYKGLAEKTTLLLKDQVLRIELGKAGRERVIKNFNIEKYVKEMDEVFN